MTNIEIAIKLAGSLENNIDFITSNMHEFKRSSNTNYIFKHYFRDDIRTSYFVNYDNKLGIFLYNGCIIPVSKEFLAKVNECLKVDDKQRNFVFWWNAIAKLTNCNPNFDEYQKEYNRIFHEVKEPAPTFAKGCPIPPNNEPPPKVESIVSEKYFGKLEEIQQVIKRFAKEEKSLHDRYLASVGQMCKELNKMNPFN